MSEPFTGIFAERAGQPLVIYHANCYDGFSAAWVAQKALGNPQLHPAKYGEEPPLALAAGRDVWVVDFSYPRDAMTALMKAAESIVVLDHHKTAEKELAGLPFCTFDMERSGCRMAWDHFFPTKSPPLWLLCVEDRDLWRMKLRGTRKVHAFVASLPMTIPHWDRLDALAFEDIFESGVHIARYIDTAVRKNAAEAREVMWGGGDARVGPIPAIGLNVPYLNASETADYLLKHCDASTAFAFGYFQRRDGRWQFSLRSRNDPDRSGSHSFDCSALAKLYGGGGHRNAAGFDLPALPPWLQP